MSNGQQGWVMWEARAAVGRISELLGWVLEEAAEPAQVYTSEDRVVVIYPANASVTTAALAKAPPKLLTRPAYEWEFERVR